MIKLTAIPEIGDSALELLEAAGFADAESLVKVGADHVASELSRANSILRISAEAPTREMIEQWILGIRDLMGEEETLRVESPSAVTHEEVPVELELMLGRAPFAIPLPARFLMERQLAVSDIPAAILLDEASGALVVRGDSPVPVPAPKSGRPAAASGNVRIADTSATRVEMITSRIKSTDALAGKAPHHEKSTETANEERISLIRGPRVETNRGRDPRSRFYIRGVLHSHPISLMIGAFFTLVLWFLLPLAIISSVLLLFSGEMPADFGWVPKWILAFPVGLPVCGLAYLIWGVNGRCRICGQKMFVPRMCLKNSKAHHVRGLGYIIPVCIHILLFKWFRCTYCGTPVRLKK